MWIRTIRSRVLGAGALRRKSKKNKAAPELEGAQTARPKGFDDFELRLGDTMRGERATIGKSLLDVQRDLKIKASYISAIENCDPGAFDTPGFVAGYVRSYAKYLGMDSEIGSIEVGKLADLVILEQNPLVDIKNTESIRYVMANGRLYDARSMNEVGNHPQPRAPFYWER